MTKIITYRCDYCNLDIRDSAQIAVHDSVSICNNTVILHFHLDCHKIITSDQIQDMMLRRRLYSRGGAGAGSGSPRLSITTSSGPR